MAKITTADGSGDKKQPDLSNIPRAGQQGAAQGAQDLGADKKEFKSRPEKLPGQRDIFAEFSSGLSLTEAAMKYRDEIRDHLQDPSRTMKVEMKSITNSITVFYTEKHIIAMTFEEPEVLVDERDFANNTIIPDTRAFVAQEEFLAGKELVDVLYITREMLNRVTPMKDYLTNKFAALAMSDRIQNEITISNYNGRNCSIAIDTDPVRVKNYFDKHSPVGTNPIQFGFICKSVSYDDQSRDRYQPNRNRQRRESIMFAVGAYVEFVAHNTGSSYTSSLSRSRAREYRPVVHISEVHSPIPTAGISALVLAIATEFFITRELWRQPFIESLDHGDICNLLTDPETGLPAVQTAQKKYDDLDVAFRDAITHDKSGEIAVVLCVDTVAGHPQYVNLGRLVNDEGKGAFSKELSKFLLDNETTEEIRAGQDNQSPTANEKLKLLQFLCSTDYVGMYNTSIIGIMEPSGNLMDTREFTYLKALSMGIDVSDAYRLTQIDADEHRPYAHIQTINVMSEGAARPTNMVCVTTLQSDATVTLGRYVSTNIHLAASGRNDSTYLEPSEFDRFAISAGANRSTSPQRSRGNVRFDI